MPKCYLSFYDLLLGKKKNHIKKFVPHLNNFSYFCIPKLKSIVSL